MPSATIPEASDPVRFEAPGPGRWNLDRSHIAGGATPITAEWNSHGVEAGLRRAFAELGTPADALRARFVNGFMYTRLLPLIGPEKAPGRLPPAPVLRVLTRVHPAFRRRTRAANAAARSRPFADVERRWRSELKPAVVAANRRLQAVDPASLDDRSLDAHLGDVLDHLLTTAELHFWLHGYDLGPLAVFLHRCIGWGISPDDSMAALANASPSTSAPTERLVTLRNLVEEAGITPDSLEDIRAAGPAAAVLLDEHLAEHGHHLVTGYDLDALTLVELPATIVAAVRAAERPVRIDHEAVIAGLRARVPAGERDEFDALIADARLIMDVRDDNGPNTIEWPSGLVRRALLEAGRRLAGRGALLEVGHALEVTGTEARRLCAAPPPAEVLARRAATRAAQRRLDPPLTLGPEEPVPPADVLPPVLADLVAMVQTAMTHMGMNGTTSDDPLVGAGVGDQPYVGRVRRAESPEAALMAMEPGDVLVVRATSPAFNSVLGLAGAVVTADGGVLSHAAVLARELGIPAVVGAPGALDLPDGATVEVDPRAGRVRLVTAG
jgi:phosphohistidine swiveling domain-containing protein